MREILPPASMLLDGPDCAMRGIVPKLEQVFALSDPSSGDNGTEPSQSEKIGIPGENWPKELSGEATDNLIDHWDAETPPEHLHGEGKGNGIEDCDAGIGMEAALKYLVSEDTGTLGP